jgi:hypothetical protein
MSDMCKRCFSRPKTESNHGPPKKSVICEGRCETKTLPDEPVDQGHQGSEIRLTEFLPNVFVFGKS